MFSLPVLHPAKTFQPCCPRALATPLPHHLLSWHSNPGRSRSLSFSGLSQAGPAGRLTPRRTTCTRRRPVGKCLPRPVASVAALCESSRPARARRAPVRSTLCAATSLVTAAWRRGGRGACDFRSACTRGPSAGVGSTAGTVWSLRHDEGGCAAAVLPRLRGGVRARGTCSCPPTRPRDRARQANLATDPGQNRCTGACLIV